MRMLLSAVSVSAILVAAPSSAAQESGGAPDQDQTGGQIADEAQAAEIVVTGVRQSLERAAEVKRNAVQIVDAIVADDIGKLPDPTVAAALQRVPGIQET